jgi:hypothetical protein
MLEGSPQPLPRVAGLSCTIVLEANGDGQWPARSQSGYITFLPLLRMQSW